MARRRQPRSGVQDPAAFELFMALVPSGRAVLKYLRDSGATPLTAERDGNVWGLKLRLRQRAAQRFGLTRYVLLISPAAEDLRFDDVDAARKSLLQSDPEVEQELLLVLTGDTEASNKIRDWALQRSEGLTVVPLDEKLIADNQRTRDLEALLAQWLVEHDPYKQLLPVTGDAFFGRRHFLGMLEERVSAGEHVGIFGLRKIGKTSVLLEFDRRLRSRRTALSVVVDLQASAAAQTAAHTAFNIGGAVAELAAERSSLTLRQMRQAMHLAEQWTDLVPQLVVTQACDAISALLTGGVLRENRLVIILDEIELLLGEAGRSPMPLAVELLRGLRAVSQKTRRLSVVVAGVNASPVEAATIAEVDNPLFSFVGVHYLGPLERAAGRELVRTIGRSIGITWTEGVLDTLLDGVGHHPLLMRLAASALAEEHPRRPYRPSRDDVRTMLASFHQREAFMLREITESLRRYYPDELELLELIALGEDRLVEEWQRLHPEALNHLIGYGVVDRERLSVKIPVLENFLTMQADL